MFGHKMVTILRERFIAWRKKRALQNIREHFSFFKYDHSDLTDEELERGFSRIADVMKTAGVTAEEASRAITEFGRAWRETEVDNHAPIVEN